MRTATTTLTRTNWATRTKTTKKSEARRVVMQQFCRQSGEASHSSLMVSFMIPFQLSPGHERMVKRSRHRQGQSQRKIWKFYCRLKQKFMIWK